MRTRGAGNRIDPRSFETALGALVADLARRRYSDSTLGQMRQAAERFFVFLRGRRIRDLRSVKEEHMTSYAAQLGKARSSRGTPFSVSTQRWHLSCLQRLFRFLEASGVLLHNPTLDLVLPSWRRLPRVVMNQEQAKRLMAHPDPNTNRGRRSRAVLELLYGTGLRVSECERLDVADVNLAQEVLFVRDGKGRKDRVVPLVGRAAGAVELYLREARPALVRDPREQALFITRHGTRLRAKAIRYLVAMHRRAAEIPLPVTPHGLRHACGTHLIKRGASVRHVQQLLGHRSLDTTAIYTRVEPVDLAKMIERSHPREVTRKRTRRPRR